MNDNSTILPITRWRPAHCPTGIQLSISQFEKKQIRFVL